ncbi:2-dehydropantoate 2-reductase [Cytobacillus sp. S13-E01]|uniref:2-dehydropantoate 2-reductase n=1 Tax=Cytobacillus sp. S13-E01 TaxID=3031326 RepID=UPI0023D82C02|nr:2-dehydropantoate 2-reductase [Cytobacillus sp. S13-E01]MDF0725290.1 2-dehydropantoate 2-reductase [Cytobacillus sp. S13-E01]
MKIGILGGGAIGLLFAAYLADNHDITIYTKRSEQAKKLNEAGLSLVSNNHKRHFKIKAEQLCNHPFDKDLVIVAVKQYHLKELLDKEKGLKNVHCNIVFIQNGMGHLSLLKDLINKNVYIGIVEHGALKLTDNSVEHTGIGQTKIAALKGSLDRGIVHSLETPHYFPFVLVEDWYSMVAEKLIINSAINPLTAIYKIPNGELIRNPHFMKNMKELYNEISSVIMIGDKCESWNRIVEVCERTAKNRSSMLKDIEEGRKTEIDAILGFIINEGASKNISLKLTPFLYDAIKGLEGQGRD